MKPLEFRLLYRLELNPCPAPRLGRADRWGTTVRNWKYHAFKDEFRKEFAKLDLSPENFFPENAWVVFKLPVSKGVKGKKRMERLNMPHRQTPDVDNLVKAVLDTIFAKTIPIVEGYKSKGDQHVWDLRETKVWAEKGSIEIWSIPGYYEIMGLLPEEPAIGQTLKLIPVSEEESTMYSESEG